MSRPMPQKGHAVQVPPGICMACFNAQQQYAFPFLVYCEHHSVLAVTHSRTEHTTYACDPTQLAQMVEKLQRGELPAQPADL